MIPKKVYYFWFSNEKMPVKIKRCIDSWSKHLKGYELIRKDLTNTEITHPYAVKALKEKKWAFLTDFCRLQTIYTEGGIYLDTDVLLVQSLDSLLNTPSFWATDHHGKIEPVVFGAEKENPIVKQALEALINQDIHSEHFSYIAIPQIITPVFESNGYAPSHHNQLEIFPDFTILPSDFFCPLPYEKADTIFKSKYVTKRTIGIHLWNANWQDPFRLIWNGRKRQGWLIIFKTFVSNPFQDKQFFKNVGYHLKQEMTRFIKRST